MSRKDPPARFAAALRTAEQLPTPRELAARVMSSTDGAHNGLRAANYEGRVSGGGSNLTQPEREAEARIAGKERRGSHRPDGLDDLIAINRAGTRALDAVDALAAECLDVGTAEDWDDALHTAHLLNETIHAKGCNREGCDCRNRLEDGLAVGYDLTGWVEQFARAVVDLRAVHRRYTRRAPTRWEQSDLGADEVCEFCARLKPPRYVERQGKLRGCRHCEDMRRRAGEYMPLDLLQTYYDHQAGQVTQTKYRRALAEWYRDCGVRPDVKGCA